MLTASASASHSDPASRGREVLGGTTTFMTMSYVFDVYRRAAGTTFTVKLPIDEKS